MILINNIIIILPIISVMMMVCDCFFCFVSYHWLHLWVHDYIFDYDYMIISTSMIIIITKNNLIIIIIKMVIILWSMIMMIIWLLNY